MRAKLILTLTLLGIAELPHAADDAAKKPQGGSATTKEQSAGHPATNGAAAATENKAGAGTTDEMTTKHPATQGEASAKATPNATAGGDVRDWSAIDADRDNSISPDEMQKFLDKTWATKQKSS